MNLVEINDFLKNYSNIIPVITLFLGAWIGNRYNVSKDRRAEFLTVSIPLHDTLMAQLHRKGDEIFINPVSSKDLLRLRSRYFNRTWFDRLKGVGFDAAVKKYIQQYNKSQSIVPGGKKVFSDHESYLKAIKKLIKYTPIK